MPRGKNATQVISSNDQIRQMMLKSQRLPTRRAEHEIQKAFFMWAAMAACTCFELECMFAIPNGERRSKAAGGRLKAEGVKAGVPDVCLPVPRSGYGALYLEFKLPGQYPRKNQKEWHERLRNAGNRVEVVHSVDEARSAVLDYLGA